MGKVKMLASDIETASKVIKNRNSSRAAESGGFVLWQMNPDMWYVELALGGSKVHAGCNGKLVWRHTPWLGAHSAKGPVRPLRRALQVRDCFVFFRCNISYDTYDLVFEWNRLRIVLIYQKKYMVLYYFSGLITIGISWPLLLL